MTRQSTTARLCRQPALRALAAAAIIALGWTAIVQAEPPTREQMETQVKGMLQSWETGNAEQFGAAFHEKLVFGYPGNRLDKEELLTAFKTYQQEKKDIKIYFGRFLIQDNRFTLTYQFAATDRKTGKRQAVGTAGSGRIEDGKIILFKEYYDLHVAKLQASGELPLDEGYTTPYPYSVMQKGELVN